MINHQVSSKLVTLCIHTEIG